MIVRINHLVSMEGCDPLLFESVPAPAGSTRMSRGWAIADGEELLNLEAIEKAWLDRVRSSDREHRACAVESLNRLPVDWNNQVGAALK
jgi:hypothetical protein